MTRGEFDEAFGRLQSIAEGNFPPHPELDRHLENVDRATASVDRMVARLERKNGEAVIVEVVEVSPPISVVTSSTSAVTVTTTDGA